MSNSFGSKTAWCDVCNKVGHEDHYTLCQDCHSWQCKSCGYDSYDRAKNAKGNLIKRILPSTRKSKYLCKRKMLLHGKNSNKRVEDDFKRSKIHTALFRRFRVHSIF